MKFVELINLTKRFGDVVAVNHLSFSVEKGEFISLLGPSGCGKTTTLRLIAGLTKMDEGEIYVDGELINDVPPHRRKTGLVFQDYALFPHMPVFDNVAFSPKLRKMKSEEVKERVSHVLDLVRLSGMEDRYPRQLSGGQQQRVALARTLASDPRVLLLDEPLSNLDAKLREHTRLEILTLQKKLRITAIYVTHDQEEALAISDRVILMRGGEIEQEGEPIELYEKPRSRFVADFIGRSNLFTGSVVHTKPDGTCEVRVSDDISLIVRRAGLTKGDRVCVMVRPGRVHLSRKRPTNFENVLEATLEHEIFLGSYRQYNMSVGAGLSMKADQQNIDGRAPFKIGDKTFVGFHPESCVVLVR